MKTTVFSMAFAVVAAAVGTEAFAGLVAATLVRPEQAAGLPCGLSAAPLDVRPAVLELHRENPGATGTVIRAENGWRVKYEGPARFTNLMGEKLPSGPSVAVGPLKVVFSDRPVVL